MASPSLESLCCLSNFSTNITTFQVKAYNATCIVSSCLSILGVVFTFLPSSRNKIYAAHYLPAANSSSLSYPLLNFGNNQRMQRANKAVIAYSLCLADLLACSAILIRSSVWLSNSSSSSNFLNSPEDDGSFGGRVFCAVFGALVQYFYLTTYFWTISFAFDIYIHLKGWNWQGHYLLYHLLNWIAPALLCGSSLITLYYPSLTKCEKNRGRLLPHFLVTLIAILLVMIINPILYFLSGRMVSTELKSRRGIYTDNERNIVTRVKEKFFYVVLIFFICWIPNILNALLLLTQTKFSSNQTLYFTLWIFMGVLNPLQGFLNSLVYRGWYCPVPPVSGGCCQRQPTQQDHHHQQNPDLTSSQSNFVAINERSHLLESYSNTMM